MFRHDKRLQYNATPDRPDPLYAKKLQEVLGGQWGEMSVMMMYLFQGWNCRGPAKYRDLLLDIATEEISHVEMLATMICRLLEDASAEEQEAAAKESSMVGAVFGGTDPKDMIQAAAMNPQHAIVNGLGASPNDSVGFPWTARYIVSSGNLLADFRMNVTAESQGRLQVARLYEMTTDEGVRDLLAFLIARDRMHQNVWLAAIQELQADGLENTIAPSRVPADHEIGEVTNQYMNFSPNGQSRDGRWANGPMIDGTADFQYQDNPQPMGSEPHPHQVDPRLHDTPVHA